MTFIICSHVQVHEGIIGIGYDYIFYQPAGDFESDIYIEYRSYTIKPDFTYSAKWSWINLDKSGDGTKFLADDGKYKTINTDAIDSTSLADTHYLQNQTSIIECMKILDNKLYELEQSLTIKEG